MDRDLVTNLIREVITENVSTILGHPKPVARPPSSRVSEVLCLFHFVVCLKVRCSI